MDESAVDLTVDEVALIGFAASTSSSSSKEKIYVHAEYITAAGRITQHNTPGRGERNVAVESRDEREGS